METFMSILGSIGIVLFIVFFFGFCIFIHEFGHLLAAKWMGLYVEKFSIGFGKALCGFKWKGIQFVISVLPLGGYVSIPQLDPAEQPETSDKQKLPFASAKARAITAFAGPFFNILFGLFLATIMWFAGIWKTPPAYSVLVSEIPMVVPVYGSDGVEQGEKIVSINGISTEDVRIDGVPYPGSLYDLCVFWEKFPKEMNLPTEGRASIVLGLESLQDKSRREVEYAVVFNPEYQAGLRRGDRIVALNGEKIKQGYRGFTEACAYNDLPLATLTVIRNGKEETIAYPQLGNTRMEDLKLPFFLGRDPVSLGDVMPDSPADAAGLQKGDQILAYDGITMLSVQGLLQHIRSTTDKDILVLTCERNGETADYVLRLPRAQRADMTAEKIGMAFFVTVQAVYGDSPAERIGLKAFDRLYRIDNHEVTDGKSFSTFIHDKKGEPFSLTIIRDNQEITFRNVVAEVTDITGERQYMLGISLDDTPPKVLTYPTPWAQFTEVFNKTARTLLLLFQPVTSFVTGKDSGSAPVKLKHMSSFVGISTMLWYSVKTEGMRGGLVFIILITFGLAFANLLPFPILDGGHILFSLIEFIIRRRLPVMFMKVISNIFAVLLILLMLYITFNDVMRLPKIKKAYSGDKVPFKKTAPAQVTSPEK